MKLKDLLREGTAVCCNAGKKSGTQSVSSDDADGMPKLDLEMFKSRHTLPKEVWVFNRVYLQEVPIDGSDNVVEMCLKPAIVKMQLSGDLYDWGEYRPMYRPSSTMIPVASKSAAKIIAAVQNIQVFDFGSGHLTKRSLASGEEL